MISLVRIDDRLIHGQVAVVWTKHLGVNRILVANDQIVNNDVQKMSLRMAAPDTAKCAIMAVKDADKDDIVSVIMRTAKTSEKGAFGDGKIFVSPLEEAYTVSTGAKEL